MATKIKMITGENVQIIVDIILWFTAKYIDVLFLAYNCNKRLLRQSLQIPKLGQADK